MTKRTRLFLLISVGILALGLGTGLVAFYGGFQGLTIVGSNGPDELAYVPRESRLLAFANVRAVMDSDLRRKLQAVQPDNANRTQEFERATGVSFENDVDTVVVAVPDGAAAGPPLVLARGRFDAVRLEGLMREHGGDAADYRGTRLVTMPGGQHDVGVAFLEPGLLAFGAAESVRAAIDTKAGTGPNITANVELMAIVGDIDNGNAWAVGRFDSVAAANRLPKEVAGQLPPISWFAASGHISSGVDGVLRADATSEQAANDLRQVIRGFMSLARLQAGQKPEIAALLDSLQLGGEGKSVTLGFSVPPEAVDALAALRQARPEVPPGRRVSPTRPQAQVF